MKNRFAIILLALSAFVLSSCQQKIITEHPVSSVLITVKQGDWNYSYQDNNNYFYASVDMPEITGHVFDKGIVKMYRVYDFKGSNPSQVEMPYVRLKETSIGGGNWAFYTETVDYEYTIGSLNIYYTASDFDYEIDETFVPETMQFRCVVME